MENEFLSDFDVLSTTPTEYMDAETVDTLMEDRVATGG
jgi:hypothetical protein